MASRSTTTSKRHGARPGPRPRGQAPRHRAATAPTRKVRAKRPSRSEAASTREGRPILRLLASVAGKFLLGMLILAVFIFGVFPTGSYVDQRQQLDDAQDDLAELQSDNAALEAQVIRLESDDEIEREAREEFNLVLPNEESYLVLPPGD